VVTKQPVLVMIQGPEPGSFYKLPDNRVTTIGRSSRNTIRAVSPSVSRFHCEIAWVNGRWELSDLNSKKGTIVNGVWIEDRHALRPGDIVRLSTTVFRFDMIEESRLRDGAILAIVEAEMDLKLAPKGEAAGSLDDIRARSRLEALDSRGRRREQQSTLKVNLAFLAVSAAAVGIIVTALLLYAHRRAAATAQIGRAEEQAAAAAAEGAHRTWAEAEARLARVPQLEAEGNHAAALRLYDEIEGLHPDDALKDLVREGRQYTVRLAHARFAAIQRAADRQVAAGQRAEALAAYRQASERIGVPELVTEAEAKIAELQPAD